MIPDNFHRAWLPPLLVAFLLIGCGGAENNAPPSSAALAEILTAPSSHGVRIGDNTGEDGEETIFGRIQDARFTESGSHVVVLDNFSPFVRVFDNQGQLTREMAEEGDGPGEVRRPYGIAVSGDTAILVHHHEGGMSFFTLDGKFIRRETNREFRPFRTAVGCEGRWLIYGPEYGPEARGESSAPNVWLRALRFSSQGVPEYRPMYADSIIPTSIGYGRAGGIWANDDEVLFFHRDGSPAALMRAPCPGADSSEPGRPVMILPSEEQGESQRIDDDTYVETIRAGVETYPGGAVALPEKGSLWLLGAFLGLEKTETYVGLTSSSAERRVSVPGYYKLWDRTDDGRLLFSTAEPVPMIFTVEEEAVINAIEE